jgi:hypothetical protein
VRKWPRLLCCRFPGTGRRMGHTPAYCDNK